MLAAPHGCAQVYNCGETIIGSGIGLRDAWVSFRCEASDWLLVKLEEGVGTAPTSVHVDTVFKTGAASLYLPAFLKWLPELDLHQHLPD